MKEHDLYTEISNGEIRLWIEQGQSICIKVVSGGVDPVELTTHEAKLLAETLLKMVAKIKQSEWTVFEITRIQDCFLKSATVKSLWNCKLQSELLISNVRVKHIGPKKVCHSIRPLCCLSYSETDISVFCNYPKKIPLKSKLGFTQISKSVWYIIKVVAK